MGKPATDLPSGIVSFLFTDIEGSTRLLGALGEGYAGVLEQHRHLLRQVWPESGGHEIDAMGDSFLVVFHSAATALDAAILAQQAIAAHRWPDDRPLRIRIGIHSGFARPRGNSYVAMALHQAARVVNAAHGGQILLSEATWDGLDPGRREQLQGLGRFRARDFDRPVALFRARARGWHDDQRPPRVRPAETHNLVPPATPVFGREQDLTQLQQAVLSGGLCSLVGPGGVGKTRLAVEFGLQAASQWPDGVWLVPLEALRTAQQVHETLADAVAVPRNEERPALDALREHLASRRLLLILDNCEHLLEPAASLCTELLQHCRQLAILSTSQAPLGLRGEQVLRLSPLTTRGGAGSPAMTLFLDRATVAPTDLKAAEALCRKLDGLPLALELAAARAATIPPADILAQLDSHLDLLRVRDPGLPERHRSLNGVLQWSIDLLEEEERGLLQCLSVLDGDFSLETAGALARPEIQDAAILVWALVEKSLVFLDDSAGGSRFRLATSVKTLVRGSLSASRLQELIRRAASHFLERFPPAHYYQTHWNQQFAAELTNLRGLMHELVGVDPGQGQALAWAIVAYLDKHTAKGAAVTEGLDYLAWFTEGTSMRIGLMDAVIRSLIDTGNVARAEALLEDALGLSQTVGKPEDDDSLLVSSQAMLALHRGDMTTAAEVLRQGLAKAQAPYPRMRLENTQGIVQSITGDLDEALASFRRALNCARDAGDELGTGSILGNLAEIALRLNRDADAARWQGAALEQARSQDVLQPLGSALFLAARLLASRNSPDLAAACNAAGLSLYQELGMALYPEDQAIMERLSNQLRQALGSSAYEQARARGQGWNHGEAAEQVAAVLRRVACETGSAVPSHTPS